MSDFEKCREKVLGLLGAAKVTPEEQLNIYEGWKVGLLPEEIFAGLQLRRRNKALAIALSGAGVIHDQEIIGRAIELLATQNPIQAVERACDEVKAERKKKADDAKAKALENVNRGREATRAQSPGGPKAPKN